MRAASAEFDVLLTADKNLQYQQHLPEFPLPVVVLAARDVRLPNLRSFVEEIRAAIRDAVPGRAIRVGER